MAADIAVETRKHNIASVSLWPGLVKTEHVLQGIQDYNELRKPTLKEVNVA